MKHRRLEHTLLAFTLVYTCWALDARANSRGIETTHYRIHSDIDPVLADDLARRMEVMFDQYARRFSTFAQPPDHERLEVYLFRSKNDYTRFTSDRFPNTGGVFIPRRKLLAAFLENQGRDGIRRTLQHEAFHQFAFATIGPEIPIWLNEGLAQVFEEGLSTGSQFMIGQIPPRRLRQLQQDMQDRQLVPFRKLLAMTNEQWSQNLRDRDLGSTQYNQAWAMAHFLVFAADESGEPRYRARLIEMLRLIRAGDDAQTAFVSAFSDNIDGFQDRFVEWARQIKPTREAEFMENQVVLADMLTTLKSQSHTFDDVASFRKTVMDNKYKLQYSRGMLDWSSADDPSVYFLDGWGRQMQADRLYFMHRRGAPLPDVVCYPIDGLQFRTRFHGAGEQIEYEILIEAR